MQIVAGERFASRPAGRSADAVGYVPENHTDFVFTVVGMTIGLVPVVGLPLPLVSYGGTSLVASLAMIGLMASVHRASQ